MKGIKIKTVKTDRSDSSLADYFKDVKKCRPISKEEEDILFKQLKNGNDKVVDDIAKANLCFIITVAKQYQNKGVPLIDLIQEGNIGLINAIHHYKLESGQKFITYAVYWIKQAILKAIYDNSTLIKMPVNKVLRIHQLIKDGDDINNIEDDISDEKLVKLIEKEQSKYFQDFVSLKNPVSLESKLEDEQGYCSPFYSFIQDLEIEDTDIEAINNELKFIISKILNNLTSKQSDIIRMMYGIGMVKLSTDDIAKRFGISTERVRQLHRHALKALKRRMPTYMKGFIE